MQIILPFNSQSFILFYFVLLYSGLTVEAEGVDRRDLDLPGHQLDLLQDSVYYGTHSYTFSLQ